MSSLLAASIPDVGVFVVSAVIVLAGALGVIFARNAVHSALCLVATLFGVAVLFVAQEAHFLAAVQVMVYAGAIVVLFLFVIMLLGVDREEDPTLEPLRGQRPLAIGFGLLIALLVLVIGGRANWATGQRAARGAADAPGENVELLGRSLFTDFLLPFEVTAVLLVIAVVGAVVLARRPPRAELIAMREEEERFRAESEAELASSRKASQSDEIEAAGAANREGES
ncbi:MAG TPA: NADH-quinone oxidoreductase subunit J [Acidimicrobiales bacterium]|jgi:NADH-quinone oxidoreductase subunit J|nr:NADH-quinone oxidoreductase subunit J [Acidimicrobiales bacterium]